MINEGQSAILGVGPIGYGRNKTVIATEANPTLPCVVAPVKAGAQSRDEAGLPGFRLTPTGVNFEWNSRPEGMSENSPAQNAGYSTRGKRWPSNISSYPASHGDARFRVPRGIQTTKYRAYLRHAHVFLGSLTRQ